MIKTLIEHCLLKSEKTNYDAYIFINKILNKNNTPVLKLKWNKPNYYKYIFIDDKHSSSGSISINIDHEVN